MNSEKIKYYLLPIFILVVIVAGIAYFGKNIYTDFEAYQTTKSDISTKKTTLKEKQDKLEKLKKDEAELAAKEQQTKSSGKPFYKPIETGLDTESVITGEFSEILQLIRANQIKVRSISYDYNPADDSFVQGAGSKYNVARLNMEMIGNYTNYDNFLKEMYKHEHFLDIQSVEIVPYKKNKKILLINCKIKLYAQK
ncbi:hypothetical protein IJ579_05115 [bacterium]|nr:hypothetical protein [bacterium]